MKNKLIIYLLLLIVGGMLGAGILYLFDSNSNVDTHQHSTEEQLYSCGMHPNIIEKESGTCPICGMNLTPIKSKKNNSGNTSGERKIIYWRAPMNPNEVYDEPGKSQMGMDLVPVYENEESEAGVVTIDGSVLQSMNVKMEQVKNRSSNSVIYTNGIISTDERKEYIVTSKISGWIEKLYVNYEGQKVQKGQKLLEIYSPELVTAQQELITALQYKENMTNGTGEELVKNAIRKLELFDISKTEIDKIIELKKVKKYLPLYAQHSGTVLNKYIAEGENISSNKQLLIISDLRNLWLKADIYENEIAQVKIGSTAEITFNFKPGQIFKGKVSFIYPTVDPTARTVTVRIELKNINDELKPAMFGNVKIISEQESNSELPSVPETAIIRSGRKNIVVRSIGDGKFLPIEVQLGQYSDGYYQILNGIKVNDIIVTSGQFMIDSESNLRSAINLFSSSESEHSTHINTDKTPTIVRQGVVDVKSIDKNGNGKVYECPMDWNVISDEDGRCPICNMFLKEYTIEETKKNLIANGYKVK
ncbi:MAG: efflux RND transporter periplasmic adaptor subunit [Melioribacteraceae bacterium]